MKTSLVFTIVFLFVYVLCQDGPEVEVLNGKLKGKYMKTKLGRKFSAFLGIPYAKPPINDLRFKDPVAAEPWEGVRDATKDSAVCPQRNPFTRNPVIEGDEDCLYLNVYTPQLPSYGSDPLPVMVFFHGGGWICGAGTSMWYGPEFLLDRDVLLVVPNYRLGPLGFLSTHDDVVPGNMAMKDQVMVLRWIRDNIAKFGGDPDSVTGFGESAGGASVHLLSISPLSKGLMHRFIAQSGTAFGSWALAPEGQTKRNTQKLAKSFDCPTDSSQEMVDCLRKIDVYEIIAKDYIFWDWDYDPMIPFKPTIEHKHPHAFLSSHPRKLIKEGQAMAIPWMTGITSDEGALRAAVLYGKANLIGEFVEKFEQIIPMSLQFHETASDVKKVTKQIKKFYFKGRKIGNDTIQEVVDLYTDGWFLEGIDESIKLHRKYVKTSLYLYYFAHRGVNSFTEHFGDPTRNYGVCHADDLQYLFPVYEMLFPNNPPDNRDKKMIEILTTLWTSFAKTGVPSYDSNDIEQWQPITSDRNEFLSIKNHIEIDMEKDFLKDRMQFWANLPTRKDKVVDKSNKISDEL